MYLYNCQSIAKTIIIEIHQDWLISQNPILRKVFNTEVQQYYDFCFRLTKKKEKKNNNKTPQKEKQENK